MLLLANPDPSIITFTSSPKVIEYCKRQFLQKKAKEILETKQYNHQNSSEKSSSKQKNLDETSYEWYA